MTVRTAELLFAVILALCSVGLMLKSSELNFGWIEGKGPGSGAWPFWLSTGMLLTCLLTIYRWFRGITPESRSSELYISGSTLKVVGTSALSILFLLLVTQFAGIYLALLAFLFLYLKFIGGHTWRLTLSLVVCVPFFIFCLFEWALKIPLPKAFTDPWFYPVYDLIYAQSFTAMLTALKAPVVGVPIAAVVMTLLYWLYQLMVRKSSGRPQSSPQSAPNAGADELTEQE